MNPIRSIVNYFRPSKLRNKRGGLAYITQQIDSDDGAGVLVNHIVTTLRADRCGFWTVDPPQKFILTRDTVFADGVTGRKGQTNSGFSICDSVLEPLRDPGDDERSEEMAWLPRVPAIAERKVSA